MGSLITPSWASCVGRIVIYGGHGALGSACVEHFKSLNWWVASVDLIQNDNANFCINVPHDGSWLRQEEYVTGELGHALDGQKVSAVLCVAGGWAGGNACNNLSKQAEITWKQSVWPSTIAASISSKFLEPGGLLTLTGAKSALSSGPNMIGYNLSKAAVHALTRSLGSKNSGMPDNTAAVAILPKILNTEFNRKWMAKCDTSTWTPLEHVAELFEKWINGEQRPPTGSLVELITEKNVTRTRLIFQKRYDPKAMDPITKQDEMSRTR